MYTNTAFFKNRRRRTQEGLDDGEGDLVTEGRKLAWVGVTAQGGRDLLQALLARGVYEARHLGVARANPRAACTA
jgi:hypothetical protein